MMYAPENKTVSALYQQRHPHFGTTDYGFCMGELCPRRLSGVEGIGPFTIFDWGCGVGRSDGRDGPRRLWRRVYRYRASPGVWHQRLLAIWTSDGVEIREWLGKDVRSRS